MNELGLIVGLLIWLLIRLIEDRGGKNKMTKGKFEKEADKWLRKYLLCCNCEKKCNCIESNSYCEQQVLKAYVDGAEPREKQIQIDAEQIRALQKQNGELTDKIRELETRCNELFFQVNEMAEQIEKMKDCVVSCCEGCEGLPKLYKEFENGNKEM